MSAVHNGNEIGDLRKNPNLEDAWNSENMKQLRLNMMNGKKSTICKHCYEYESHGKFSERKQYNRDYKRYYSRVAATKPDGSLDELNVPLVDIRFSNKCNYKCRICDSAYSSLWHDEEIKIGKINPHADSKEMRTAEDDAKFWESYTKMLPNVKRLHFAGGEPLFMDEHYQALEHLIAIGNTDVVLSYNTNFSTLRYKKYDVISMWNKFKSVDVWASLDGMSEKGDYQRKGQKWENIESNIRTIQKECPSVLLGVNVTVSMLNILDIPAFYQYMVDNKFVEPDRMNLYLLFYPQHMNITNLPPAIKEKAKKQFEDFDKNYLRHIPKNENIRNHISAVISYMMGEQGHRLNEFRHWINAVDAIRGERFTEVYPELAELMENNSNDPR
jgi:MoaA/NifB/PqqE/SkfB family radical SAM enzyme